MPVRIVVAAAVGRQIVNGVVLQVVTLQHISPGEAKAEVPERPYKPRYMRQNLRFPYYGTIYRTMTECISLGSQVRERCLES
jgi:hypothetical protein